MAATLIVGFANSKAPTEERHSLICLCWRQRMTDAGRRLSRLERTLGVPPRWSDPQVISIKGGLPKPYSATVGTLVMQPLPGEDRETFGARVLELALEARQPFVVLSGLPE
jgi:hypothetical protein